MTEINRGDFKIEPTGDGRLVLTFRGSAVITDDAAQFVIDQFKQLKSWKKNIRPIKRSKHIAICTAKLLIGVMRPYADKDPAVKQALDAAWKVTE